MPTRTKDPGTTTKPLTTNPFHYCNVTGAHIKLWEEQGVLEPGDWTCENVSVALELWAEFKQREANAESLIEDGKRHDHGRHADRPKNCSIALSFYQDIYDFLDAERFAQAAANGQRHETGS